MGGWNVIPERNAQTNLSLGNSRGLASLWTGTELFVYKMTVDSYSFAGSRFNPATGLWNPVPTHGQPSFDNNGTVSLVQGGSDVFVFGRGDTLMNPNSIGGIFNLTSGGWRNIPTNGLPSSLSDLAQDFGSGGDNHRLGGWENEFWPAANGFMSTVPKGSPQVSASPSAGFQLRPRWFSSAPPVASPHLTDAAVSGCRPGRPASIPTTPSPARAAETAGTPARS